MGLAIAVETESGERREILPDTGLLSRFLPGHDDGRYRCLSFIDLYGVTVFNHLQVPQFLREWAEIRKQAQSDAEREVIDKVARMAEPIAAGKYLFLKFFGD